MEAVVSFSQQQHAFRGSIVREYLLVAEAEGEVRQQVETMRHSIPVNQDVSDRKYLPPHLLLANFLAKEEMEETLLRWMHRIINAQHSFTVALNNYGSIPGSNALFLRVQDHQPFRVLAQRMKVIDELVRSNGLPRAYFFGRPGMIVADGLTDQVFEKLLPVFARQEFYASFNISALLLYRRTSAFDEPRQVTRFELQPPYKERNDE